MGGESAQRSDGTEPPFVTYSRERRTGSKQFVEWTLFKASKRWEIDVSRICCTREERKIFVTAWRCSIVYYFGIYSLKHSFMSSIFSLPHSGEHLQRQSEV